MKHIPNILSIFRITLIPFFILSLTKNNTQGAGFILIISGLTDVLDGYLARTFNWFSKIGALLDPLADKITQTVVAFSLIFYFKEYAFFFMILVIKDLLMIIASVISYRKDLPIASAKWFGKASTFLFYLTMLCFLLIPSLGTNIKLALLSVCTAFSIYAVVMYLLVFTKARKEIEVVAAALFDNDKMLITQRQDGDYKNLWEIPGGKIEPGESHQEALIREIQEELLITIDPHTYITTIKHQYPTFKLVMHVYASTIEKGKPTLTEHAQLKWVSQNDIRNVEWLPADIKLIEPLNAYYDSVK